MRRSLLKKSVRKTFNGIIIPLVVGVSFSSCSDRPKNIPSDSEMVKVMADIEMAQAYLQNKGYSTNTPENRERILKYVLEKNNMDRAEFDSTLSWYGRHIDRYDDLYAKVDKELARRERNITGNANVDLSSDLWPYSRHLVISSKSSTDNLVFNIPAEEIEKGGRLTWKFRLNAPASGSVMFGVKYEDGGSAYINQSISGTEIEVNLQTDTARKPAIIFGNLRIPDNLSFVRLDSIFMSKAPFDSTMYYRIHSLKRFQGPKAKIRIIEKTDSVVTDSIKTDSLGNGASE